ncbi:DUF5681 domain-containing protein [uncultured Sphingomonas sp.]|uniref:DUF5681 domain-containing protein n=1 Tax=uncultured Sphingomonas sp. TaxID=158754 RepID=UPI0025883A88|nr:DUF5681 domain-containing protein [uncultured Sphingomonas sp.]
MSDKDDPSWQRPWERKKQPKPGATKGYCLPPREHTIKPGEKRNPWGRKGKPGRKLDPVKTALSQPTQTVLNGKLTEIDAETALMLVHMKKALAGDARSAKLVLDEARHRGHVIIGKSPEELATEAAELAERERLSRKIIESLDRLAEKYRRERLDPVDPARVACEE